MKKQTESLAQFFIAGLALGVVIMGVVIYALESDPPQHSESGVSEWSLEIGRSVCAPYDGLVEVYPSGGVLCGSGHRYAGYREVNDALHFLSWLRSTTTTNIEPSDDISADTLNCTPVRCTLSTGVTQ